MNQLDVLALQNLVLERHLTAKFITEYLLRHIEKCVSPIYVANSQIEWEDWGRVFELLRPFSQTGILFEIETIYKAYENATQIQSYCNQQGYIIKTIIDCDYPLQLRQIPNPPIILYSLGNVSLLSSENTIAVIGSRRTTSVGKKKAYEAGEVLGKKGMVVVSGLALGCDTLGHKGALDANGSTVAFLPNELDFIVPYSNSGLAERIVSEGGCLVSEYTPSTPLGQSTVQIPPNYQYVERDRLQAGLSKGIFVVETDINGGTMHTVRFALEQKNRSIACVDLDFFTQKNLNHPTGNASLIRKGIAQPILDTDELLKFANECIKNNFASIHDTNETSHQTNIFETASTTDKTTSKKSFMV